MVKNNTKILLQIFLVTLLLSTGLTHAQDALRINTGGTEIDYNGENFVADINFSTGSTLNRPQTGLPEPYQSFRFSRSQQMSYAIPLADGEYIVNLHFAELWFGATGGGAGGVGSRIFDVSIEGDLAEDNLDVFAEVGANAMLMKSHTVTVSGGVLNIDFDSRDAVGGERHPVINAIEILSEVLEPGERPFITTWKTDNSGDSGDNQITIPTYLGETYDYIVDWGDGTTSENVTGDIIHTYVSPGNYTVLISGAFPRINFDDFFFNGRNDSQKILSVDQWGDIEWSNMQRAFQGCKNLDVVATDVPNLTNVSIMSQMFEGCTELKGTMAFNDWDVSNVTVMSWLFKNAESFNQDIGNWDISKVWSTWSMFEHASSFNQDIGGWDVSNVSVMLNMFVGAESFNQDIGSWDVSKVEEMDGLFGNAKAFNQDIGDWDVSSAHNLMSMFAGAENFNQDIGDWDVSNVSNMDDMFHNAAAFDQDLGGWDVSGITWNSNAGYDGFGDMFTNSGLSNENYDKILIGWSQLPLRSGDIALSAPQNQYCEAQEARQFIIDTYGWTINDAGKADNCEEPNNFELRINTGGSEVDYNGNTFMVDTYSNTGSTVDRPQTGLPEPYQSFRFSRSQQMSYNIPLADGEYTVNLYFAELWFGATGGGAGGVGNRVFDVNIEGALSEDNLDVFAEVGADAMLMKTYTVTVTDGMLDIDLDSRDAVGGERHPIINAIEVLGEATNPETRPFVTTWKTDYSGISNDNQITIPTHPSQTYNYTVDWGDGTTTENITGDIIHTYETPGTYSVSITGEFPQIYFYKFPLIDLISPIGDTNKLISVDQWGDINWKSFEGAFTNCEIMDVLAQDIPNLNQVESMKNAFDTCKNLKFNDSINQWDLSNVTDMSSMFYSAEEFNQNIGDWNVSNVTNMNGLFHLAYVFNKDIGGWDVSNVTDMGAMFRFAKEFNQNIGGWDVSQVTNMGSMFNRAEAFDQDIGGWEVSNVTLMYSMFNGASDFNQYIGGWDVSNVTNMNGMFEFAEVFNQDIGGWDVSNVTNMGSMFRLASDFNQYIGGWDVSNVTNMNGMFEFAEAFNQDIGGWDVSNVIDMSWMFYDADAFNQNIGAWDVSRVTDMHWMFRNTDVFDQNIGDWDVSKVTDMRRMFESAQVFNQDIGDWDVSSVEAMDDMFNNALAFDQDLGDWNVSSVTNRHMGHLGMVRMFNDSGLSNMNYDKTLIGWSQLSALQNGVLLSAPQNQYCDAEQARQILIDTYGWMINDAGKDEDCNNAFKPFITTWKTDNPGISADNQIIIPTNPSEIYDYNVDWGDGSTSENVSGNITHTYSQSGTYTVSISGQFPAIYLNDALDVFKFVNVEQWGDIEWATMHAAFYSARFTRINATDIPNLSNVEDMSYMFFTCLYLEEVPNIDQWDVSNIKDMTGLFNNAESFKSDIGSWNVSSVTNMTEMFKFASQFNSDIGDWDVGNVETLVGTFAGAGIFNQNLSGWDVSNVQNMTATFNFARSFNQDIGSWDIQNVSDLGYFLNNTAMSTTNYDNTLDAWANLNGLNLNLNLGAVGVSYCNAVDARQKLMDDFGWTIEDAGKAVDCEEPSDFALRINAGGSEVNYNGDTFIADAYSNTGNTLDRPQTGLEEPFQTFRFSRSQQMSYDIPVADGEYTVNLYFAELWFGATGGGAGGVGNRVFDVNIEGALAEDNLDVFAEVGTDAMLKKTYTITVAGGVLDIDFDSRDVVGGERHPIINAIEILGMEEVVAPTLALSSAKSAPSNSAKLTPNPVQETTSLSFNEPVQLSDIQLYDVAGRLVRTFNAVEVSSDDTYNLKVHDLESGTYFINAIDAEGVRHQKQMVIIK